MGQVRHGSATTTHVVADDHLRLAALDDQIGQFTHDPPARDRRVHYRPKAFARHVVEALSDQRGRQRRGLVTAADASPLTRPAAIAVSPFQLVT